MKIFLLVISILFLTTLKTNAQWETTTGPVSGDIPVILKAGPAYLASAPQNGVYISMNEGASWTLSNSGITDLRIVCGTSMGNDIFIATPNDGILRSQNYGQTWNNVSNNLPQGIEIHSMKSTINSVYLATSNGVFFSSNAGASWSPLNNGLTGTDFINIAIHGNQILTNTASDVFLSSDLGATWNQLSSLPSGSGTADISFCGSKLLLAYHADLYLSSDNGQTWNILTASLPISGIYSCIATSSSRIIFGAPGTYQTSDLYMSEDTGQTWQLILRNNPDYGFSDVFYYGSTIVVSSYSSGIYKSDDLGLSWNNINNGLSGAIVTSLSSSPSKVFACSALFLGQSVTSDEGLHWTSIRDTGAVSASCFLATIGEVIFQSSSEGPLKRTTDNGLSWINVSSNLPSTSGCSLLKSIGTSLYICIGNQLFMSPDSGTSWTNLDPGLFLGGVVDIAQEGSDIFAVTQSGVFYSGDNGVTWYIRNQGLIDSHMTSVVISGSKVFASANGGYVVSSTLHGSVWVPSHSGIPTSMVSNLFVEHGRLYAATNMGVFMSPDSGLNWLDVNDGLGNLDVLCFTELNGILYAGFWGGGVWKRNINDLLDIKKINSNNTPIVYPTPAVSEVNISFPVSYTHEEFEVFDVHGKMIDCGILDGPIFKYSVNDLAPGVYFLKLTNRQSGICKIVKN